MNRRSFFARTAGAVVAAVLAPLVKWHTQSPITTLGRLTLTYHGAPLVFDQDCPSNQIYFLAADGPYIITRKGAEALFS